jgi:hypothetical protein
MWLKVFCFSFCRVKDLKLLISSNVRCSLEALGHDEEP